MKASGEKTRKLERSNNILETERRRAKREEKIVVRIPERIVRKVVQNRKDQAV